MKKKRRKRAGAGGGGGGSNKARKPRPAPKLHDVNKVDFVCVPESALRYIRRKYAKGITSATIVFLERCHYADMTNEQAEALPATWTRPNCISIRKASLKYIKNPKHRLSLYMQYARGISLREVEQMNKRTRTVYFAWKLGWNRERTASFGPCFRRRTYMRYSHMLLKAKEHADVKTRLDEDDDFLYNFLRRFRKIELGFKETGDNHFPVYETLLSYCCDGVQETALDRYFNAQKPSTAVELANIGEPLLQAFFEKEKVIANWKLLVAKKKQLRPGSDFTSLKCCLLQRTQ